MVSKQICIQVRQLIVQDKDKGVSNRAIARKYCVSEGAVRKILKKFVETKTVSDKSGRGRKRKTTTSEDRQVLLQVKKKSAVTSTEIQENLSLQVSTRTICRRLNEFGLKNSYAQRRPLISKKNKIKRLAFAREHVDKPISFWKTVLWSDESKFELFGNKRRSRVWTRRGEKLLDKNIQKTVKHGGGNIMVWGCFSWAAVGNLVTVDGRMTADAYIDIISENLEESLIKCGLENKFIFQQDNDPKHKACKTMNFFRASKIKLLEWPPQSPDLNPIENMWSILDDKLVKSAVTNKTQFFEILKKTWDDIEDKYLRNLVESMPRRLQKVIKAKGGATKY